MTTTTTPPVYASFQPHGAELRGWIKQLRENPSDWTMRLVFRDWLHDRNLPRCHLFEAYHLDIVGRLWHSKRHGNTYHVAYVHIELNASQPERNLTLISAREYGYGNAYEQTARNMLVTDGYLPAEYKDRPFWHFTQDTGIVIDSRLVPVRRRRDL